MLHTYDNWAKCAFTSAVSEIVAKFFIVETEERSEGPFEYGAYIKILEIDFKTGEYSFLKQIKPFEKMPYGTEDYYSLQICKYVADGNFEDFFISGLTEGLDSGSQLLSY